MIDQTLTPESNIRLGVAHERIGDIHGYVEFGSRQTEKHETPNGKRGVVDRQFFVNKTFGRRPITIKHNHSI